MGSFPLFAGPNDAGELRAYLNKLALGLTTLGSGGGLGGSVTVAQMRKALVATGGGAIYTVANANPADVADSVNIEWTSGPYVSPGDPLAVAIQSALGINAQAMANLFALAGLM